MVLPYRSELQKVCMPTGNRSSVYGAVQTTPVTSVLTRVSFRSLILPEGTAPLFGIGGAVARDHQRPSPPGMVVSTDPARGVGARLRAAKDVIRCILAGNPLPLPFAFAEKGDFGDALEGDNDDEEEENVVVGDGTQAALQVAGVQRVRLGAGEHTPARSSASPVLTRVHYSASSHSSLPSEYTDSATPPPSHTPHSATATATARYDMTDNVAGGGHRVRSAPSLQSNVLGTIQRGRSVLCRTEVYDGGDGRWFKLASMPTHATHPGWKPDRDRDDDDDSDGSDDSFTDDDGTKEAWMLGVKTDVTGKKTVYLARARETSPTEWLAVVTQSYSLFARTAAEMLLPMYGDPEHLGHAPTVNRLRTPPPQWNAECDFDLVQYAVLYHVAQPTLEDFKPEWLTQFPRISSSFAAALVWRLRALRRVVALFDTVLDEIIPVADDSVDVVQAATPAGAASHARRNAPAAFPTDCAKPFASDPFAFFESVRHLFPLSSKLPAVIDRLLRQTSVPMGMKDMLTIQIDRRKARRLNEGLTVAGAHEAATGVASSSSSSVGGGGGVGDAGGGRRNGSGRVGAASGSAATGGASSSRSPMNPMRGGGGDFGNAIIPSSAASGGRARSGGESGAHIGARSGDDSRGAGAGAGAVAFPSIDYAGWPGHSIVFQTYASLNRSLLRENQNNARINPTALPQVLSYRWPKKKGSQWWEVNFIGEGIIDQGGGFRDLLTEIAEELCPPDSSTPTSTPLFIRTPNHRGQTGEHQAAFAMNPECTHLKHLEWVGKLMGAAIRSEESVTLALTPLFWKRLCGIEVTWQSDFNDVDATAVALLASLREATPEDFDEYGQHSGLPFCTTLSSGQ